MTLPWHYETDAFRIRKMCLGSFENNCFVVACRHTGEAVIVDAAAEPERILAGVADVTPRAILTTHGHFDHVGAARQVADALAIPFQLHAADADLSPVSADADLELGAVHIGDVEMQAIHTPGHTPGSACFRLPGVVLTGDTLFPGGPGATVSPGSSFEQIITSIETHLLTLPAATIVMPGHGLDTTIGTEAPALPAWIERGW